jgi:endonuclease/exonuclease/phosphatase family metal-dependent hydrolase
LMPRRLPTAAVFRFALVLFALFVGVAGSAHAQLRMVTYNTRGAPGTGMDIVLKSIGEEQRNGIAKPIDVLMLQETSRASGLPDTQGFVNLLNSMYAGQTYNGEPITYARGNATGNVSFSDDTSQSLVYRVQTVQLISETAFGAVSGSGIPRQPLRYQLRPVGYDSTADFYVYNSHYKASQDAAAPGTNANRRNIEAIAVRNNSNALGEGAHVIYAGDFNFYDYDAEEPAWGTLTAAGAGQAFDPINRVGTWHENASFADVHTQSPCTSGCGDAGGAMDDRFDFQLTTGEFLDGEGLSYINGSYHAFGNNGTTYNRAINNGSNTVTFPGVTSYTRTQILNALATVTDHIPVVADYQVPAVMSAIAGAVPATLYVGDVFNFDVTVSNIAKVLQPLGADELDYSVTTAGSLIGSYFSQVDAALGGGNVHQIGLNTATPGEKIGVITIASASQGVKNQLIEIPISFEVLEATLAGDFNGDGTVDAADYTVWRDGLGADYDQDDYVDWKNNFGQSLGSGGVAGGGRGTLAVPEPGAVLLALVGACLMPCRLSRRLAGS